MNHEGRLRLWRGAPRPRTTPELVPWHRLLVPSCSHRQFGPASTGAMKRLDFVLAALLALAVSAFAALAAPVHADEPDLASEVEVRQAYGVLQAWVEAYMAGDNETHLALTHPRIRYWHPIRRWSEFMDDARERNGQVLRFSVTRAGPITAEQLPCTEMNHCYRDGLRYVVFFVDAEYENVDGVQQEYAVMADSEEGWRFGGGSILNRPMGETAVILNRADEHRYRRAADGMGG